MKIGVIGAGPWGRNIIRTLHELGALAGVADLDPAQHSRVRDIDPEIPMTSDYHDLLARRDITAVAIATPAATHHQISLEALQSGRDVFVEKPMTLVVSDAEELVRTAQRLDRILMVGHLLLYKPAVQFIRRYLVEGRLGRVFTLHQQRAKLGRARAVENALWSLGVHDLAALLHIIGEAPSHVSFFGHCGLQPGVEDDTHVHLTFPSGVHAHLHNSWLWPKDSRRLVIVGDSGMLVYDETRELVQHVKRSVDRALASTDAGTEIIFQGAADGSPLRAELEHFVDCLRTRREPMSSGSTGLDVMRTLEAARASSIPTPAAEASLAGCAPLSSLNV